MWSLQHSLQPSAVTTHQERLLLHQSHQMSQEMLHLSHEVGIPFLHACMPICLFGASAISQPDPLQGGLLADCHASRTTSAVLRMQEIAACSQHHTEVALVSDWSPNLSFWSEMTPVATLHQPPAIPLPPYSSNCTYVAIITSDGDSLQVSNDAQGLSQNCASAVLEFCNFMKPFFTVNAVSCKWQFSAAETAAVYLLS